MNNSLIYTFRDKTLFLMFIGMILFPLIGFFFGKGDGVNLKEQRVLAKCPRLGSDAIKTVPDKFEAHFNDYFGFRKDLIRGHNWIKYKFFKGGSVGKVIIGKNDWLFYTKAGIIPDFLGQAPLTEKELFRWKSTLESHQIFLASKGIHYLFVVVPNKATVYPEMLPKHISRNRGRTRLDQLSEYLTQHSTVAFLDLRNALLNAKSKGLIYHPQDTHWTSLGAFVGYQEICSRLLKWFPDIRSRSINNYDVIKKKKSGDLADMLGLGETLAFEREVLIPREDIPISYEKIFLPQDCPWPRFVLKNDQFALVNHSAEKRLILFHDSFGERGRLRENISSHFARTTLIPVVSNICCLDQMIEQEKPDIVIHEIAERKLIKIPNE